MTATPDPAVALPEEPTSRHEIVDPDASSRGRAARVGHFVCLGAGVFALAVAVLLPLVVYPRLAVLPADPQQEQILTATGATVLMPDAKNPAGATQLKNVDVTVSNYVSQAPDVDAGDSVVWQIATEFTVTGHGMANARVEQISLNPHTALPTNCCGDRIVTSLEDTSGQKVTHQGYLTWPFNSQKKSYQIWDINLQKAKTATYQGEEERNGVRTYRYHAEVPLQNIGTMDLPGGLFGVKDPTVTAQTQYSDVSTYWIEPNGGDLVALDDQITQQYVYDGKTLTAFAASLHTAPNDKSRQDKDQQAALALPWLRARASLVLVPVGLILIAAGVYLGLGRRRRPQN